jgi:heme O synthase-like polyprenyltransferase
MPFGGTFPQTIQTGRSFLLLAIFSPALANTAFILCLIACVGAYPLWVKTKQVYNTCFVFGVIATASATTKYGYLAATGAIVKE